MYHHMNYDENYDRNPIVTQPNSVISFKKKPHRKMASHQDHYSLRWNNHQNHILRAFDTLLQTKTLVDVTLVCAETSIRAHKMVLSACSPFFQRVFSETPCKHPVIVLKDFRGWVVQAIIDFMYRGEISVPQERLQTLIQAGESLQVRGLVENSLSGNTPTPAASPDDFGMMDTTSLLASELGRCSSAYDDDPSPSMVAANSKLLLPSHIFGTTTSLTGSENLSMSHHSGHNSNSYPEICTSPLPRRKQARPRRRSGECAPHDLSKCNSPLPEDQASEPKSDSSKLTVAIGDRSKNEEHHLHLSNARPSTSMGIEDSNLNEESDRCEDDHQQEENEQDQNLEEDEDDEEDEDMREEHQEEHDEDEEEDHQEQQEQDEHREQSQREQHEEERGSQQHSEDAEEEVHQDEGDDTNCSNQMDLSEGPENLCTKSQRQQEGDEQRNGEHRQSENDLNSENSNNCNNINSSNNNNNISKNNINNSNDTNSNIDRSSSNCSNSNNSNRIVLSLRDIRKLNNPPQSSRSPPNPFHPSHLSPRIPGMGNSSSLSSMNAMSGIGGMTGMSGMGIGIGPNSSDNILGHPGQGMRSGGADSHSMKSESMEGRIDSDSPFPSLEHMDLSMAAAAAAAQHHHQQQMAAAAAAAAAGNMLGMGNSHHPPHHHDRLMDESPLNRLSKEFTPSTPLNLPSHFNSPDGPPHPPSPLPFPGMSSALGLTPPHMFGLDSPLGLFPPGMDPGKLYNPLMEMSDPRGLPPEHPPFLKKKSKVPRPKGQHSAPRGGPPRSWTNAELTEALQHVWNKKMTTSQASRIFGIPYNSLLMYVRGKYGKSLKLEQLRKDCISGPPIELLRMGISSSRNRHHPHHQSGKSSKGHHGENRTKELKDLEGVLQRSSSSEPDLLSSPNPLFNPFPPGFYPDFPGGFPGLPLGMLNLLPPERHEPPLHNLGIEEDCKSDRSKQSLEDDFTSQPLALNRDDSRRELLQQNGQD